MPAPAALTGTPTSAADQTEYTYTVTDDNDNTATLTFDIQVNAAADDDTEANAAAAGQQATSTPDPLAFNGTVADQTFEQAQEINTITLPDASGGDGSLTYTLTPALPAGLTFDASARTITGKLTGAATQTEYTYTVTDDNSDTDTITFSIKVEEFPPPIFKGTIADQTFEQNQKISTIALPDATGGHGSLTYTLSPALPAGLSFDASARTLTGTPTSATDQTKYSYTVTDDNGNADIKTFNIMVNAAPEPLAFNGTISDQTFEQNQDIGTLALPDASGGSGALTYTLTPALPAGLSFDASARTLTGTPTSATDQTEYTYTVTDDNGNTATLTFDIQVNAAADDDTEANAAAAGQQATSTPDPLAFNGTVADQTFEQAQEINTITLPDASGGDGSLTYTLTPALPAGLTFDASARTITGKLTGAATQTEYTYTVTDDNSDTDTIAFSINVEEFPPPIFKDTIADQTFEQDQKISTITLPNASGGHGSLTYTLTPALPAGLTFDGDARTLTGTPTSATDQTEYTYTVTDDNGNTDVKTFNITVNKAPDPLAFNGTVSDQTFTQNQDIGTITLPNASGGSGSLSYTLSPDLPAGLTFSASARTITGTPTSAATQTQYTYTVSDARDSTATMAFDIQVWPAYTALLPGRTERLRVHPGPGHRHSDSGRGGRRRGQVHLRPVRRSARGPVIRRHHPRPQRHTHQTRHLHRDLHRHRRQRGHREWNFVITVIGVARSQQQLTCDWRDASVRLIFTAGVDVGTVNLPYCHGVQNPSYEVIQNLPSGLSLQMNNSRPQITGTPGDGSQMVPTEYTLRLTAPSVTNPDVSFQIGIHHMTDTWENLLTNTELAFTVGQSANQSLPRIGSVARRPIPMALTTPWTLDPPMV